MSKKPKQRGSQPASSTPLQAPAGPAEPSGGSAASTWSPDWGWPKQGAARGILAIVATPIGNLGDITQRAVDCLAAADLVLCEDTRVTGRLLAHLGLKKPLQPYHDHNAARVRPKVLERLAAGETVALVSDAGTPLISDPGYRLVREAAAAGHTVTPVPGPSALLAALVVAGLPTDRFLFVGFLPAKSKARRDAIEELKFVRATLVFYEAIPRLVETLDDLAVALGPREAVVTRELTKRFESIRRLPLNEMAQHYRHRTLPKGEIVLLVGPPAETAGAPDDDAVDAMLRDALARLPLKSAVEEITVGTGRPRNEIYRRALALQRAARADATESDGTA
jgi:16S rRNA (cytidine1402-2'-O)-methyltransferase